MRYNGAIKSRKQLFVLLGSIIGGVVYKRGVSLKTADVDS
jgi:hypothetical protein